MDKDALLLEIFLPGFFISMWKQKNMHDLQIEVSHPTINSRI